MKAAVKVKFEIDVERLQHLQPRTITTLINWLRSAGTHLNWPLAVDYVKPVTWVNQRAMNNFASPP